MSEMNADVEAVVRAWTEAGPRPDLHRRAQRRLRKDWPTLAAAIERLAAREFTPDTEDLNFGHGPGCDGVIRTYPLSRRCHCGVASIKNGT